MKHRSFTFTPESRSGAKNPPLKGKLCQGVDLSNLSTDEIVNKGIDLSYVIDAYKDLSIGDKFFTDDEISRLSVVAPKVILNIIHDYEVVEKKTVETPDEIRGIVKCNNPKCITNNEPMPTHFHVSNGVLTCHYCEKEQDINKVELV